ncbi:hypothetical protein EUX98_g1328 [Antrodiella citrinella]|uniref:Uncharacterized protein n=1 Tax=Antrodiella citrinella TaxID=2447956 RepID=A0A4S4NA72_9APHY|nr:hypothetical protein EUX98_g1328 [Antrodiella citrinella]
MVYADALVFTNNFNEVTKTLLEKFLKTSQESVEDAVGSSVALQATARMHLSLVLKQMDIEPEDQRKCAHIELCDLTD